MRIISGVVALLALTACAPSIPDSAAGVGFSDYQSYERSRAARDSELRTGQAPAAAGFPAGAGASGGASGGAATSGRTQVISSEELSAAGLPVGSATATVTPPPAGTGTGSGAGTTGGSTGGALPPLGAGVGIGAEVDLNNPGISDEQDFKAVAARESIESDRARLEAQREAYRVIQPTAVPTRPGDTGPNVVQYALSTSNQRGQKVYSRFGFKSQEKYARACAAYASPDLAQTAFLREGGPDRDRLGVDPDGDGFACSWDPAPYRQAARN
ncbi:hypothetical protein EKE94_16385 [Mesobaculum littorinae]|uniref:Excalibur calcium-binding domain-containing protein n=1 Tax=Mesobaculum littorinae TaxID=2486419 RepID=A0A438AE21_9RHOB|nr:hypothetical protein [Mesobaculum littorinae]RVV96917.1 hypothetical protein EKE94_16385 [Mesobaculum littorinae]